MNIWTASGWLHLIQYIPSCCCLYSGQVRKIHSLSLSRKWMQKTDLESLLSSAGRNTGVGGWGLQGVSRGSACFCRPGTEGPSGSFMAERGNFLSSSLRLSSECLQAKVLFIQSLLLSPSSCHPVEILHPRLLVRECTKV